MSDDLGLVERLKKAAKPIKVFAGVSSRGAVYRTDKPLHATLLTEAAKALAAKDAAIERLVAERDALLARETAAPSALSALSTVALSRTERRLATFMAERFGQWVYVNELVDAVFFDDPNGGPLRANNSIAIKVLKMRTRLNSAGLMIEGNIGPAGGRRLVWGGAANTFSSYRARQALGDT